MLIAIGVVTLALASFRLAAIFMRGREPWGNPFPIPGENASVGISRAKGSVRAAHITFDIGKDLSFTLYREGVFDRLSKALGIAHELETGDVPFDGRIYVQSEDPAFLQALRSNRELRNSLFHLMRYPTTKEVSAAKSRLWIRSTDYNGRQEPDDVVVSQKIASDFLDAFRAVRAELDKVKGSGTGEERDATRVVRQRIFRTLIGFVLAGVFGLVYAWWHTDHQVVQIVIPDAAWLATLVVFLTFLFVMWLSLGATAFTHRVLLDILIVAIPGAWFAAFGAALWFNEAFDASVPRHVATPVVQAYASASRKNRRWYLQVARWPDARADRTVDITWNEYSWIVSRRCVDVVWRDGRLGDGWVEQYAESASPTCEEGVEK